MKTRPLELSDLRRFVAGADVFSRQSDGTTVAGQYAKLDIRLSAGNTDRINGWAIPMRPLLHASLSIAAAPASWNVGPACNTIRIDQRPF